MNNGKSSIRLTLIALKRANSKLYLTPNIAVNWNWWWWWREQLQHLIISSLGCWSSNKTDNNGQADTNLGLILSSLKANLSVWAGESAQPGSQWEDRKMGCRDIDQLENSIWQWGDSLANRRRGEMETSGCAISLEMMRYHQSRGSNNLPAS